jgi:hypothetical protein
MLRKQKILWIAVLMVSSVLSFQAGSFPSPHNPQQKVTVTAVEVPVRVLLKGEVIRDLTKEDFEVFQNGIKQEITKFEIVSRRIASAEEDSSLQEKPKPSKRLFLLIFNIFDYNRTIGEAIDYFFEDVFQPGDQLVVLAEGRVLNVEQTKNPEKLTANLKESLRIFKSISTFSSLNSFRELENEAETLLRSFRGDAGLLGSMYPYVNQFLDNYKRIWDEYRNQFLASDLALHQNVVARIKPFNGEKWAICFQQREMFPKIKNVSRLELEIQNWLGNQIEPQAQVRARLIQTKQQELQRSFDFTDNIPVDALSNLFLDAGITYHLILVESGRTVLAQDFELKEVSQDYENDLKAISRSTGGYLGFSNQVSQALQEAASTEDYHYLLVYSPKESLLQKETEITVKVNRAGVDVIYLKRFTPAGPLPVVIGDFNVRRKTISFSLRNYQMTQINDKRRGLADVRVTIFDEESNKIFEDAKTLDLVKEETKISISFDQLKSGSYFIIISAFDRVASKSDVYSGLIKL